MHNPQHLPWPVPDTRSYGWAGSFADMHDIVRDLDIPDSIPVNTARAFETARELVRFSFYRLEFAAVAVAESIHSIEAAFRELYPKARNLDSMIRLAEADGTITAAEADHLQAGREIRNRHDHGKTQHPALPIPWAAAW